MVAREPSAGQSSRQALERLRQDDQEFKVSVSYIARTKTAWDQKDSGSKTSNPLSVEKWGHNSVVNCLPDMLMAVVEAIPPEENLWSRKGLYLFENSIAKTTPPAFLPFWLSTHLGCKQSQAAIPTSYQQVLLLHT